LPLTQVSEQQSPKVEQLAPVFPHVAPEPPHVEVPAEPGSQSSLQHSSPEMHVAPSALHAGA
jgi:hypothetical protein